MPTPKRPSVELPLPRKFEADVAVHKAKQAAELRHQADLLKLQQERFKADAKALDKEIAALELQAKGLEQDQRTGMHAVPTMCEWELTKTEKRDPQPDGTTKVSYTYEWLLFAKDTGEIERREPTNAADLQLLLAETERKTVKETEQKN